jgi:hypothetical protein
MKLSKQTSFCESEQNDAIKMIVNALQKCMKSLVGEFASSRGSWHLLPSQISPG